MQVEQKNIWEDVTRNAKRDNSNRAIAAYQANMPDAGAVAAFGGQEAYVQQKTAVSEAGNIDMATYSNPAKQGQEEKVLALAAQHGMEDFYAEKYLDTLRVGAGTEPDELFDKSHGFYIAVIQGFFRDYYYTRGSAFSFLVEEKPEYARYFTPWAQVTPTAFPNPAENQIIENYCAGVYLSPKQVVQLLRNLEQDPKVCEDLERIWSNGQLAVLKKALTAAAELSVGLLEATEVLEPNPIRPNESTSYSNLYHCDRDGVYLYIDTVSTQLADVIGKSEEQA